MLKRTPGKWSYAIIEKGNNLIEAIVVKNGNDRNGTFEFVNQPLIPTLGDFHLTANAPDMHELIHEVVDEIDAVVDEIDAALPQGGVFTQGLRKIRRKASALLEEINVERTIQG